MSLVLNGTSQYAHSNTEAVANEPFTVSVWFKSDNVTLSSGLWSEDDGANANHFVLQPAGGVAGDPVRCCAFNSTWGIAATTSGYSASIWTHACGVWTADDSRAAFIDGGDKGTNTDSRAVVNITHMVVGLFGVFFDGKIAEVAVWDVALSDGEIASLASGDNPTSIQLAHLVGYWPLLSDADDDIGSNNLTLVNTPSFDAEDHPIIDAPMTYVDMSVTGGGTGGGSAALIVGRWLKLLTEIDEADIDHGGLGGLTDDDHTIYFLADGTRNVTGASVFAPSFTTTSKYGVNMTPTWYQTTDIATGVGCAIISANYGSGNITGSLNGFSFVVTQLGSGTITLARGIYGQIQHGHATGVITTAYTLQAASPYIYNTGTIGTLYGLYVSAQANAKVTTAYGIYQAGASDINNFVGKCKFGTAGTPAENVHASDTVRADTAFNLNGTDGVSSTYAYPASITVSGGIITAVTAGSAANITLREGAAADYTEASFTQDGAWHDLDLSAVLPAGTKMFWARVVVNADVAGKLFYLRKNGNTGSSDVHGICTQVGNISNQADVGPVGVDTNRVVEYMATNQSGFTWSDMQLMIQAYA